MRWNNERITFASIVIGLYFVLFVLKAFFDVDISWLVVVAPLMFGAGMIVVCYLFLRLNGIVD